MSLKNFPLRMDPGRVRLLERDQIFYIEAERDDSPVRTARKGPPPSEAPARPGAPPIPPFFRIHRSYLVNRDRAFKLWERGEGEYEIKMVVPQEAESIFCHFKDTE